MIDIFQSLEERLLALKIKQLKKKLSNWYTTTEMYNLHAHAMMYTRIFLRDYELSDKEKHEYNQGMANIC